MFHQCCALLVIQFQFCERNLKALLHLLNYLRHTLNQFLIFLTARVHKDLR